MAELRGRRPRRRRKVCIEEVLPSTDLPPLVQGDLRCFLVVDIGKIVWSSTATAQVPPASPAYIRLRWWGETSEGTVFKPSYTKNPEKTVKCRCRFGVRSGAKQMSAYFVDMGSIVFELLTSPKSVPLGRIQIPKVAHLTSSNPVRGYFPIISPSSRKIGEIEIHIRFKSLEAAYDLTTDTGTDTSISSRSRPPSDIGKRSRSRGSSIGSRGSARSRSSSAGSRKTRRKKRSASKSSRRRSVSTESNASSTSRRSNPNKKGSSVGSSTPRGVDNVLEQNGKVLYCIDSKPSKSNLRHADKFESQSNLKTDVNNATVQQDAISVLLQRGNRLKENILKSQFMENDAPPLDVVQGRADYKVTSREDKSMRHDVTRSAAALTPGKCSAPAITPDKAPFSDLPKLIGPVKERRQDLDMRFVDLVFGSQEFTGANLSHFNEMESFAGSPLSSMISELEDNPLYDESLLQQMFYNHRGLFSLCESKRMNRKAGKSESSDATTVQTLEMQECKPAAEVNRLTKRLSERISGIDQQRISALRRVYGADVTIETLTIYKNEGSLNRSRLRKGRGRGGKPPVPSPKKGKPGTYFVEFRFPEVSQAERAHPSSMTTTHDFTRVVSRKVQPTGTAMAIFDEKCEFPFKFTDENLLKWSQDDMEFAVYQRKATDKKACILGTAKAPLGELMRKNESEMNLDVVEGTRPVGSLKVFFELLFRPERNPDSDMKKCEPEPQQESKEENADSEKVTAEDGPVPSITFDPPAVVLSMMVMVPEGINIPGTTVTTQQHGTKSHPPNVSLVCRTLTPGECDKTPVVWGQNNPKFDFVQVIPLKMDQAALTKMKDNLIIIEVWAKVTSTSPPTDKLLGLVKLPTNHFYQTLKDEQVSKVVLNSLHPLIAVDEAMPVMDLFSGQERGHLQVTLALGTQAQIASLRQIMSDLRGRKMQRHHLGNETQSKAAGEFSGPVEHAFEMKIVKLHHFKPPNNQFMGDVDCFVQYLFPTQQDHSKKEDSFDVSSTSDKIDLASMEKYRSEATLCTAEPVFNYARRHRFVPPPSVPVQRILLACCYGQGMPGGIPLELWTRQYRPNCRDKIIAKGTLPMAKVGSLVSMSNSKVTEQSFNVPMMFVETENENEQSAGFLEVVMRYKASGTTLESMQPALQFSKPVILRVSLLRACGLKSAASLACRQGSNNLLEDTLDLGVNTYVEFKPSFLPDEDVRTSRIVAMSFAPEYQHHMEIACPLVSYHRDVTPVSLAELLLSGEVEIVIWHRPEDADDNGNSDVALARQTISTRSLLHKTTGIHGWHCLHSTQVERDPQSKTVGGLELSIAFANTEDLDLVLKAAKATKWELPPLEKRLLNDHIVNDVCDCDSVTFSVTVTNAWLLKTELLVSGQTSVDKSANVYVRYKFYDHDSVVTTRCPITSKQPQNIDAKFENLISARIAHKKSFVCKRCKPLRWYLQEEKMELQLWLTHCSTSKNTRPSDSDKLLGSCFIEFCSMSEWGKEQHISGSYALFKSGADEMQGQVRVYVSMKPGESPDPIPNPTPHIEEMAEKNVPNFEDNTEDSNQKDIHVDEQNSHTFEANVTVERAFHIPQVNDLETDEYVYPNVFVTFEAADDASFAKASGDIRNVTIATKIVKSSENAIWNEAKTVSLPQSLLSGVNGAMLLKVWHRDRVYLDDGGADFQNGAQTRILATDRMLGFATVDLSVLRAGLRDVNGWYNVLDIHGQCQGQLKVAVTPGDSSLPGSARSNDPTIFHPPNIPPQLSFAPQNFLHKLPIHVPVQTPSGSMYVPGVRNTDRDNMSESTKQILSHNHPGIFKSHFTHLDTDPQAPTVSMFRYVSSDRQQAALVDTLEKQIKELDLIKRMFQDRQRSIFADGVSNGAEEILGGTNHRGEFSHESSVEDAENMDSHGENGVNIDSRIENTENPDFTQKNMTQNGLRQNESSSVPTRTKMTHENFRQNVSGYDPTRKNAAQEEARQNNSSFDSTRKNTDEEFRQDVSCPDSARKNATHQDPRQNVIDTKDEADSDTDCSVEFVRPHSSNARIVAGSDARSDDQSTKITDKPPKIAQKHNGASTNHLTPAKSEIHDDTSLWLTGSMSKVSGFSSDEENSEVLTQNTQAECRNVNRSTEFSSEEENPEILLKHTRVEHRNVEHSSGFNCEEENPEILPKNTQAEHVTSGQSSIAPVLRDDKRDENSAKDTFSSDASGSVTEDCNKEELSGQNDIPDNIATHTENPNSQYVTGFSPSTVEGSDNEVFVGAHLDKTPPMQHQVKVSHLGYASEQEMVLSPSGQNGVENTSDDSSEPSSGSQNEENRCPNRAVSPKNRNRICESFYPSPKNLRSSIRELQEAALAHEKKLSKRRTFSNESQGSRKFPEENQKLKPKRTIPNTVHFSDERTRRLARIFRTKFSE